jgi:hypothetical protein
MDELKKIQSDLELENLKTQLKKEQFIKQMKSGLGEHIKNNGGKVNVIKKSKLKKFWEKILKIF